MPATYEPIATTTLGSAAASITFSSIPATYTDLIVVFRPIVLSASSFKINFNSDTGTNYSSTRLIGDGSTATSDRFTNATYGRLGYTGTTIGLMTAHIFSYAGSTNKTGLIESSGDANGSGSVRRNVILWRNTSAITTINVAPLSGNIESGTTATLYGILKA